MAYLYLDLETLPTVDPDIIADIAAGITPPGSMSKPETIAKWEAETKPGLVDEAVGKTALTGALGRIAVIGWAWNEDGVHTAIFDPPGGETREHFQAALNAIEASAPNDFGKTVVGHNVSNFDIRFLWQRAMVLGVRMPVWMPRDPKPWSREVHDTMVMWSGSRDWISLDKLCRAMSIPGKGDMSGSDVAAAWLRGEFDRVAEYCAQDVERVRSVHRKMLVATGGQ